MSSHSSAGSVGDDSTPEPLAHYSPVVVHANVAYCSGCLGVTGAGALAGDDVARQTRQALANLDSVLKSVGSGLEKLLSTSCFLARADDFDQFDATYDEVLASRLPARTTVVATLLLAGALVEISAIASLD